MEVIKKFTSVSAMRLFPSRKFSPSIEEATGCHHLTSRSISKKKIFREYHSEFPCLKWPSWRYYVPSLKRLSQLRFDQLELPRLRNGLWDVIFRSDGLFDVPPAPSCWLNSYISCRNTWFWSCWHFN